MDPQLSAVHVAPENPPICRLECEDAFNGLSEKEKLYAHYFGKAVWAGAPIACEQTSAEGISIFTFLQTLFSGKSVGDLKQEAAAKGVSEDEFRHFMEYVAAFYGNMGNFQSFGDTKIVPRISAASLEAIAALVPAADALFKACKDAMYNLDPTVRTLGLPEEGSCTNYYSPNITKADIELVQSCFAKSSDDLYNQTLWKDNKDGKESLRVLVASAVAGPVETREVNGSKIEIHTGNYAKYMAGVVENLEKAREYAANEHQVAMLNSYVASFRSGSINEHKDAQRHWIRDKGPAVETNIGFIETYRDPFGVRGEWEGFVSIVNREQTRKFQALVDSAQTYLAMLPWPPAFEKDTFQRPDFTSLEVLAFGSSGIPAGINIPNYDDIRGTEGFKNVSLGNVLSAKAAKERVTFLSDTDGPLFDSLHGPAFEVQVGCHELLGHGSGKLLCETAEGVYNFDVNNPPLDPFSGQPVSTWYKQGESWDGKFAAMASSYEECRAECVGIYLSCNDEVLKTFGHEGKAAQDVMYVNWLIMARAGLLALEFYTVEQKKWRQAHMQARFAILKTLLRAGQDFVKIARTGEVGLEVQLDASKIKTVGVPAICEFLGKLNVYKASADFDKGSALYLDATTVDGDFLGYRDMVMAKKKPRKVFVQANTRLEDGQVKFHHYDASPEGMVQSFVERYA